MGKTSKEDLASIVGQRLKELRKAKTDLGQKDVADEIGITGFKQLRKRQASSRPDYPH